METERQFAQRIKAQSARLAEEWPPGSKKETDLIAHWRRNSPKMVARLERLGTLAPMAHLLIHECLRMEDDLIRAGWHASDARTEAAKETLMMEPEDPETAEPSPGAGLHEELMRAQRLLAMVRAGETPPEDLAQI